MAAVALVLANPVSDGTIRQASVGLLFARGEVGDLGTVDDPFGHAFAWDWALFPPSMAVTSSTWLVVFAAVDLDVMLVQHLCHVRHGRV